MEAMVNTLKALSDETRLRIVNLLYEKELCVCDIMEALQITQTKASRHLNYLKHARLVKDRKYAQWVHYSILRDETLKYIDILVMENLRQTEQFQKDLSHLEHWLQSKNISC